MSEQNILNPTATSLLNFDYGYEEEQPETFTRFQAESGKAFGRRQLGLGRTYNLLWQKRDLATKHALQQWAKQYENDFFSLQDFERGRYFSGRFDGPLNFSPQGNNNYSIKARFIELPGLAMFAYPTNWTRDSIFIEEKNSFGEDAVKRTGVVGYVGPDAKYSGGFAYYSGVLNDFAEWVYFGYGFQYWSAKATDAGILEYTVTRLRDGAVVAGPTTADQYANPSAGPQVIFSVPNLPLDLYRLKIRVTGTKNVSSTSTTMLVDAIQVMQ